MEFCSGKALFWCRGIAGSVFHPLCQTAEPSKTAISQAPLFAKRHGSFLLMAAFFSPTPENKHWPMHDYQYSST